VRVVVEASQVADAKASLVASGATVERAAGSLVQVLATPGQLRALLDAPGISYIRAPLRYSLAAVTGEGVALTNALAAHTAGNDGSGVKIAIVDGGFQNLAAAQASGDIPSSVTSFDYCSGQFSTATVHGTAVTEIVHEMAPGASLYLFCINSEVGLANAEAYAKANGISIISHSMGWYNSSRGDGSGGPGSPDAIAADAAANGILWVNAAGNDAQAHWSGTFVNSGDDTHLFAPGDDGNSFYMPTGTTACALLKWDAWPTTTQDYDLYIVRSSTMTIVAGSENDQYGQTLPPEEGACYTNTGSSQWFFVGIVKYHTTTTPRMDLFLLGGMPLEYQVVAGSVAEPASSAATFAVGATCWRGTDIEPFSSQGPTIDGRTKPDITGPDQVSGTTYGATGASCSNYQGFPGTSASTPHVAGAAALVKVAYPSYTIAQIRAFLETHSVDQGDAGKDNVYGAGLLLLPDVPEPPTDVTGVGYDQSVAVSWVAPAMIGNGPITGYTATSDPGGFTCTTTGELTCAVYGLTNGTPYTFTVTATNGYGTSDPSDPSAAVTPSAVPDAPVVTVVGSDGHLDISWVPPNDNGSPITSYRVDVSPGGNFCEVAGTMCGFSGLTNGVTYTITVFARNANGDGMPTVTTATPRLGNSYVGLTPTRILDTGAGIPSPHGPITG
jgi:hypothetical protein